MNKNKIVAFVIPSIEYGGAELQVISQINYLSEAGCEIILIVIDKILTLREGINLPDEKIFELHYPVHVSFSKSILKAHTLVKDILFILKKFKVEIVLANLPFSHYVMRLVKAKSYVDNQKFRLINYHHSLQYTESPLDTLLKKTFNVFNSFLARITDDKNIFISDASRRDVQKHFYVKDPVVIFNSIPYKIAKSSLAYKYFKENNLLQAEYIVVMPGRLNKAKGHSFFIGVFNSFIKVNNIKPNQVQLFFAGGGLLEEQILSSIKAKGLEHYVHITGFIPNDLLLSFLSISNLVIIPSVFEGFGNVAIEALMVNKLILASDAGGLKEIVRNGENGFIFRTLDEKDCLEKLTFLYNNRSSTILPKEKLAQDFANRFSFGAHIQKLIKEINSCAE